MVPIFWRKGFGLTGLMVRPCTWGMGTIKSESGIERPSGLLGRCISTLRVSGRKVATGAAAVLAVAVGYHVVFGANGLTVYMQKRQETRMLAGQVETLQHENDLLQGHVQRLQDDPDAIEHQARDTMHYTRPGEVIVAISGQ